MNNKNIISNKSGLFPIDGFNAYQHFSIKVLCYFCCNPSKIGLKHVMYREKPYWGPQKLIKKAKISAPRFWPGEKEEITRILIVIVN
jgi:hypothetical protein